MPVSRRAGRLFLASCGLLTLLAGHAGVGHAATLGDLSLGSLAPAKSDLHITPTAAANADALAHYSAALQFESAGKLRLALDHYLAVFKADPSNAELASHTAVIAMQFQGREAALKILEDAVKANPDRADPLLHLARFCSTYPPEDLFAKNERALQAITTALAKFPQNTAVYEAAVMIHLTENHRDEAIKVIEQATKQESNCPRFWLDLGSLAERIWPLGQTEFRADYTARVSPFFETALKHVTAANEEEITLEVAKHFLMTNNLARSQQLCEKLAADHGSLPARKLLYRMYEASQQEGKALAMLEQVVKQAPEDAEHQRLLARSYEKLEKPELAIPHYEAAIQHGGGEFSDYVALGDQLWMTRKHEQMIRLGERTVKLFPDHPISHYQLALGYRAREQYVQSAAHFAEAEQIASSNQADMLNYQFYYQYGITLEQLERHEEASRVLEKSITLTPREKAEFAANTMNYLGFLWLEQGTSLDKAGELITKANELVPNSAAYIDSLGWFHFKKGDFTKALAELQRAEKLIPEPKAEDAEIYEHIGLTYQQLGNKPKALEHLERAVALKTPDPKMRERIEKNLKKLQGLDTEKK